MSTPVVVGSIVQVNPSVNTFGACMVVVTELKLWGIQGYVQSAGVRGGQQYIRLNSADYEPTGGMCVWIAEQHADEGAQP